MVEDRWSGDGHHARNRERVRGDRPVGIDRWLSYLLLTVVGWIGLGISVVRLLIVGAFHFTEPAQFITNGPGLWIVVLGLAILSRATYDMAREPAYR